MCLDLHFRLRRESALTVPPHLSLVPSSPFVLLSLLAVFHLEDDQLEGTSCPPRHTHDQYYKQPLVLALQSLAIAAPPLQAASVGFGRCSEQARREETRVPLLPASHETRSERVIRYARDRG